MTEAPIKCVLVGDMSEGKTELAFTYTTGKHPGEYIPTVFQNCDVDVQIGSQLYGLRLVDTAGSEDYDRSRPLSYPDTDVFLLVFSVVSRTSLENIKIRWTPEITYFARGVPFVLVGSRIELRDDPNYLENLSRENQNPISYQEGKKAAKELGAYKYVECSPRKVFGIKEVFHEAILAALDSETNKKKRSSLFKLREAFSQTSYQGKRVFQEEVIYMGAKTEKEQSNFESVLNRSQGYETITMIRSNQKIYELGEIFSKLNLHFIKNIVFQKNHKEDLDRFLSAIKQRGYPINLTLEMMDISSMVDTISELASIKLISMMTFDNCQLTSFQIDPNRGSPFIIELVQINPSQIVSFLPDFVSSNPLVKEVRLKKIKLQKELLNLTYKLLSLNSKPVLQNLSLLQTQLTDIPIHFLSTFSSLKSLDLSNNQINSIEALETLFSSLPPSIEHLNLSNNNISSLPQDFKAVGLLQRLIIKNNHLQSLSPNITKFSHLKEIDYRENPMSSIPKEILEEGKTNFKIFIDYLKDLGTGAEENYRVKLLIVGYENVGKTTLVYGLQEKKKALNTATDGIEMISCQIEKKTKKFISMEDEKFEKLQKDKLLKLNISVWDFAGQVAFYSGHQFFLSHRSFYIIVFNAAETKEPTQTHSSGKLNSYSHQDDRGISMMKSQLKFWLLSISAKVINPPCVLVGTHIDQCKPEVLKRVQNEVENLIQTMKTKHTSFPDIKGIFYLDSSSYTSKKMETFRESLVEEILKLSGMGEKVPALCSQLETLVLEERKKSPIPVKNFKTLSTISMGCKIGSNMGQLWRSVKTLSDWGVVAHFGNEMLTFDHDVFLSYHPSNEEIVEKIKKKMDVERIRTWSRKDLLKPITKDGELSSEVGRAISHSGVFIFLATKSSFDSIDCQQEIDFAYEKMTQRGLGDKIRIIVLKYDEFETAQAGIQMMLNKLPVFDCRTDLEQCIGLVLKDIKGIIQKRRIKQLEQVTKIENTIKTEHLSDLIILNPQWLAGVIGNLFGPQVRGFIKNGKLEKKVYPFLWPKFDPSLHQRIVDIMRCLGISFIDLETESFDIVPNCFSEDSGNEINSAWNGYLEQFSETISIIDKHDSSFQPTYKRIKWSYPFIPPGYFSRIIAQLSNYLQLELYSSNSVLMSTNGSKMLIQLEGKENYYTLLIELVSPTLLIACTVFGNILHELNDFHQNFYLGLSFKFVYPCHLCCWKYFIEEKTSSGTKSKFHPPSEFNEEEFNKEKNYGHNCSYHGSVLEIDLKSYVKEKGETSLQDDCFISFSFRLKEDNQLGLKVRDHLSKLTQTTPISCHYYVPRNDEALAIKNSKVFLFILSKNSITDAHCIRQINLAYHYQKLIFPLAVDPDLFGKLESGLAMILSRFQWTNWISKDPKDLESFKLDITTKIASSERNVVNENEIQDFDITFGKSLNEEYHSQALISYSHRDGEEFAKNIKEGLKSQGIKVWMDDQIRKGHLWRTEIAGNLLSSKVLIFIQTIESSQSPFCEEEVRFAHSKNKQVIVFDPKSIQVKFCSPQFEQIVKQSTIFQNQDSIPSLIQCVQKIVNSEIDKS